MNVTKPGLARVYRVTCPAMGWTMDRIVRVVTVVDGPELGGPYWQLSGMLYSPDYAEAYDCLRDDLLLPIGNPGDDAVDESLLWKPVPSTKETA